MLQRIEEACPVGAHAALVVPPTWITRVRRHQVTRTAVFSTPSKESSFRWTVSSLMSDQLGPRRFTSCLFAFVSATNVAGGVVFWDERGQSTGRCS